MHEIREIIKLVDQSTIQEFELESEGTKVSIKKAGAAVQAAPVVFAQSAQVPAAVAAPVVEVAPVTAVQAAPVAVEKPAVSAAAVDEASLLKVVSPMVGTFYRASEPGKPAYAQVGDQVTPSKVVCIVEAMKLFNEIEAEVSGEIVKVLVEDGQLVEYGQPLFLVKP
ncbi:acetyl-CoA carboxylase biotin carboxyl carrier protein [Brevibacillus fluminis]|uniref:Biotin carboxyl carrier protein of acetyl-CoA carboxylase n=2 Tax=Brevibacillus fluminis TaxID=511487 RepID=A0A3M8D279_9BACL|nr:acetyl-CoA carboxylase biotin carboxyl carrier protein [Brevibacillus fluminis]